MWICRVRRKSKCCNYFIINFFSLEIFMTQNATFKVKQQRKQSNKNLTTTETTSIVFILYFFNWKCWVNIFVVDVKSGLSYGREIDKLIFPFFRCLLSVPNFIRCCSLLYTNPFCSKLLFLIQNLYVIYDIWVLQVKFRKTFFVLKK